MTLSEDGIRSTEDLTRALRSNTTPLQQRLELAWAIFNGSNASRHIQQISSVLVRKNELLVEWVSTAMLRGIKKCEDDGYAMHKDASGVRLLLHLLLHMNTSIENAQIEIQQILSVPIMPLFIAAISDRPPGDLVYLTSILGLWRFIVEQTSDGAEAATAQPDQLAQFLTITTTDCLDTTDKDAQPLLLEIIMSVVSVFCASCENTLNARRIFMLFDKTLLLPLMRLATKFAKVNSVIFDLIQTSIFHIECMCEFMHQHSSEKSYVSQFYKTIDEALADTENGIQYVSSFPILLSRYLQASTLMCPAIRSKATTKLCLSALAANPMSYEQPVVSASCLRMFSHMYRLLLGYQKEIEGAKALKDLVDIYYCDQCFGTVNNASIVGSSSETYQQQLSSLEMWLSQIVIPTLSNKSTSIPPEFMICALESIDLTLKIAPDLVQEYIGNLISGLSNTPDLALDSALDVLDHLLETLAKTRQLDSLISVISSPATGTITSLLTSARFITTFNRVVSQHMPFAQVTSCLDALARAIPDTNTTTLSIIMSNLLLATASSLSTENQRVSHRKHMVDIYSHLMDSLSSKRLIWERLIIHYTVMETASRIDGLERWMESCMYPDHVAQTVLSNHSLSRKHMKPKVHVMYMLVVFQTAAHWSSFLASLRAGAIPEATANSIDEKKTEALLQTQMNDCLEFIKNEPQNKDCWGPWDGQAQSVTEDNVLTALWSLLTDWLELVCEYSTKSTIEVVIRHIITGFLSASDSGLGGSQRLLRSAGFYEITAIRDSFVPVLREFACTTLQSQTKHGSKLAKLLSSGNDIDKTITKITKMSDKILESAHCFSENDLGVWYRLMCSLLNFPMVYWTSSSSNQASLFSFVLLIDLCIARSGAEAVQSEPSIQLHTMCRIFLDRLMDESQSLSAIVARHAVPLIDLFVLTAKQSQHLTKCTSHLLYSTVTSLGRAAFGQSNVAANNACYTLATTVVKSLSDADTYMLDCLCAISSSARQYAHKDINSQWLPLVELALSNSLPMVSSTDQSQSSAVQLGIYSASLHLKESLTKQQQTYPSDILSALNCSSDGGVAIADPQLNLVFNFVICNNSTELSSDVATRSMAYLIHSLCQIDTEIAPSLGVVLSPVLSLYSENKLQHHINAETPLPNAILWHAIYPLLSKINGPLFEQLLSSTIKLTMTMRTPTLCQILGVFTHTGFKQKDQHQDIEKRKSVQRNLGSIFVALNSALARNSSSAMVLEVISVLKGIAQIPYIHINALDISEILSAISYMLSVPGTMVDRSISEIYCDICQLLCVLIRHHADMILRHISPLVTISRTLIYAFITLPSNHPEISQADTPWILSRAPLPPTCATSFVRIINELVRTRRPQKDLAPILSSHSYSGNTEYVKLTRGTNTASASAVLGTFASYILAEYCIIQGGGIGSSTRMNKKPTEHAFGGLNWRPLIVLASDKREDNNSGLNRELIDNPVVRELLNPAWYGLFDLMQTRDRESLLSTLTQSSHYEASLGGTGEVLKSLYKDYLQFYKYTGEV